MTAREVEAAKARLDRMAQRRHTWLLAGGVLVAAAAAGLFVAEWLAVGILAGGCCVASMGLLQSFLRHNLIQELAVEPQAYVLSDVRRFGAGLVLQARRRRLAASLDRVIENAGQPGTYYLTDRVEAYREQIRSLARAFRAPSCEVDPTSAAICLHLLTSAADSPLYNWQLPPESLGSALLRIRAGIRPRRGGEDCA